MENSIQLCNQGNHHHIEQEIEMRLYLFHLGFGNTLNQILNLGVREDLGRMKFTPSRDFDEVSLSIKKKMNEQFDDLISKTKNGGSL